MTASETTSTGGRPAIDRNLALELVRATEAAALAASRHLGRGDKEIVDQAAVDAMRPVLNTIAMRGTVVIGEGEKDEAPMLYNGEEVGDGTGPEVDFAVDPVDGTTLTAKSLPNALAIVAVSERHTMFDPGPCVYMDKIAIAGDLADVVDFNAPIETTLAHIAKARGVAVPELTVCILDRPRHEANLVRRVREAGSRIKFLLDGDVAGAIMAADDATSVDVCVGIGGTPEGVITACALKCMDGAIFGRLYARDDAERAAARGGFDLDGRLAILTVGGIEPRKGSLTLLDAFAAARDALPDRRPVLLIAGGATLFDYRDEVDRFHARAAELGINGDLRVLGPVSDDELEALYRAADVFALPSAKEGFGLAVLEALAAGLPAVVSDLDVFRGFLDDEASALLAPAGDADALAGALVRVAREPALADRLRAGGRAVVRRHTWARVAEAHEAAYRAFLAGRAR
jgi:fructose-1,6-bisphosphatase II